MTKKEMLDYLLSTGLYEIDEKCPYMEVYYEEQMIDSYKTISLKELVERFIEIDKEYNGQSWDIKQILANINIITPIENSKFNNEKKAIMDKYRLDENHASCYISNHGKDKFICTEYNKGCEFYDKCNEIYSLEYNNEKDINQGFTKTFPINTGTFVIVECEDIDLNDIQNLLGRLGSISCYRCVSEDDKDDIDYTIMVSGYKDSWRGEYLLSEVKIATKDQIEQYELLMNFKK